MAAAALCRKIGASCLNGGVSLWFPPLANFSVMMVRGPRVSCAAELVATQPRSGGERQAEPVIINIKTSVLPPGMRGGWLAQNKDPPMKIAQVAALMESVPPRFYGGTERIASYL